MGAAVGYAMSGGRAVAELMYADFMGRAGDEIFNQLSKWQSMSAGQLKMPVVLRISVGAKYGAQHSQDWTALVHHIPGLKVVYPVTPYDAKGMMAAALAGTDPVVFFESQKIYDIGELFVEQGVPEVHYEIDLSEPSVKRKGKDLTIITLGPALYTAVAAADRLEKEFGISAEIIDLRAINPLNYELLVASVRKTGKVLLASDAVERGCALHTVATNLTQLCFDDLDAPPVVVGSRNWITPAPELEGCSSRNPDWLLDAVHERILPLKGYRPHTNPTLGELARRARRGRVNKSGAAPAAARLSPESRGLRGQPQFRRRLSELLVRASGTRYAIAAPKRADACQPSPALVPTAAVPRSFEGPLCEMQVWPMAARRGRTGWRPGSSGCRTPAHPIRRDA